MGEAADCLRIWLSSGSLDAMPLQYVQGDLFSVRSGVLAHACNCHGVWGGGIASAFRQRFPGAFKKYSAHCSQHSAKDLIGSCLLIEDGDYKIACLFTNDNSTNEQVAECTESCLADLARQLPKKTEICMPRINAGIFAVPWELTECVLKRSDLPITVYTV